MPIIPASHAAIEQHKGSSYVIQSVSSTFDFYEWSIQADDFGNTYELFTEYQTPYLPQIVKRNRFGKELWTKRIGSSNYTGFLKYAKGYLYLFYNHTSDGNKIVKLDLNGNVIWANKVSASYGLDGRLNYMRVNNAGQILFVYNHLTCYLFDSSGNAINAFTYTPASEAVGRGWDLCENGDVVCHAISSSYATKILRFTSSGTLVWAKQITNTLNSFYSGSNDAVIAIKGNYVYIFNSSGIGGTNGSIRWAKLDLATGNLISTKYSKFLFNQGYINKAYINDKGEALLYFGEGGASTWGFIFLDANGNFVKNYSFNLPGGNMIDSFDFDVDSFGNWHYVTQYTGNTGKGNRLVMKFNPNRAPNSTIPVASYNVTFNTTPRLSATTLSGVDSTSTFTPPSGVTPYTFTTTSSTQAALTNMSNSYTTTIYRS